MNQGSMVGFTRIKGLPPGASFPEMKVRLVNLSGGTYDLSGGDIDTLLLINSASPVTLNLGPLAELKLGSAIHIAQYGAGQVTVTPASGVLLRTAASGKTRVQFSVVSLMKILSTTPEWLIFGDMAAS